MIAAIVAVDNEWGIGYNGDLLEHIPEDLKFFKKVTENNTVIMGLNTWDSLPKKPLPNRVNIVISYEYKESTLVDNNHIVQPMDVTKEMLELDEPVERNYFIVGGGSIYKQLLPYCDIVYVTKIYKTHENIDTFFPNLDIEEDWYVKECSDLKTHKDIKYQFLTYQRIS